MKNRNLVFTSICFKRKSWLVLFFTFFLSFNSFSQVDFDFWFALPEVTRHHGGSPTRFVMTAFGDNANVTISVPADPLFPPINLAIPANGTVAYNMSQFLDNGASPFTLENVDPDVILNRGILISSDFPITAYYEVNSPNNPDIFTLKGRNALDREFFIPIQNAFNNNPGIAGNPQRKAWASFDIVATEDNTNVTITPTKALFNRPAGVPFTITLNRGQTFSCRSVAQNGADKPGGSKVVSDKPISITVKDDSNYSWTGSGAYDLIGDQIVGTSQLGTEYIIIQGPAVNNDRAFIFGTQDNTQITVYRNGEPDLITNIDEGEIFNFNVLGGPCKVEASNPIYVFHVTAYGTEIGGALLPPLGCSGSSEIAFTRSNNTNFSLLLFTEAQHINNFTITSNGQPVALDPALDFVAVPGPNTNLRALRKVYVNANVVTGAQTLITNSSGVFHAGMVNGTNSGCRYGYFSGYTTINLGRDRFFCKGDSVLLDAGILNGYLWSTGDTTRTIWAKDSDKYIVEETGIPQCVVKDSIVLSHFPAIDAGLTPDTAICQKKEFTFNAVVQPGYSYLWSTGDTTPNVTLQAPDTFRVDTVSLILTDTNGCLHYDTTFTAFDTVVSPNFSNTVAPNFNRLPALCDDDTIPLILSGTLIPNANYISYFSGPGVSDPDSTDSLGIFDPRLVTNGEYMLYYTFMDTSTQGNCSFTDSVNINILPFVDIFPDDTLVCEDAAPFNIQFSPNGGTWTSLRFDALGIAYTPGFPTIDPDFYSVNNVFLDTIVYGFIDTAGCFSTDTMTLLVYQSIPTVDTAITLCADTIGIDSATYDLNQLTAFFQQGVSTFTVSYFLDNLGNNPVANPAAAKVGSATLYARVEQVGESYSEINFTVNPLPEYPLLTDTSGFCAGDSITLDATAGVGGPFTYLWNTGATSPTINVKNAGNYWIQKTNTSTNCVSSDTAPMVINPLPIVNFIPQINYCFGDTFVLSAHNGGNANDFEYLWNDASTDSIFTGIANFAAPPELFFVRKENKVTKCFIIDSILVAQDTLPVFTLRSDTAICDGDSFALLPSIDSVGYSFTWFVASAIPDTVFGYMLQAKDTGIYRLQVRNIQSCESEEIVSIQHDTLPPTAICHNDTSVYLNQFGFLVIDSSYLDNGSFDKCGLATLVPDRDSLFCADIANNPFPISLLVTDNDGLSSTCITNFTVLDTTPPIAFANNLTIYLDNLGDAVLTVAQIDSISTDSCGILSETISQENFDCSHVGMNNVVFTVTDVNGNVSTDTAQVEVLDTVRPDVFPNNLDVILDANGAATITVAQVDSATSDACGIDSLWISQENFDCNDVGIVSILLFARDVNGNIDSANAVISVFDTVPPIAIARDLTLYLNNVGLGSINVAMIDSVSTDSCGVATRIISQEDFDCSHVGQNTVFFTVSDVNGNTSIDSSIVTVIDTVKPVVFASNLTLFLDVIGQDSITVAMIDSVSSDSCGILSRTISQEIFDCSHVGMNNVVFTVTDVNGNVSTDTAQVQVLDTVRPVVFPNNLDVILDANGAATITVAQVDSATNDACGIDSLWISQENFDCNDVGIVSILLFARDVNGNIDSANAVISVFDTVPPIAIARDLTLYLNNVGLGSITVAMIDSVSTDSCGVATRIISQEDFDCSHVGQNTVFFTVSDVNGNTSIDSSIVTVIDTVKPVFFASNLTLFLNAFGQDSITVAMIDSVSSDSCGILSRTISQENFDCSHVGMNNVVFTVTDVNGNINTDTAQVQVFDLVPPTLLANQVSVYLDAFGQASVSVAMIDSASNDACGLDSLWLSKYTVNCATVPLDTVVFFGIDVNGNSSSMIVPITVIDTIAPEIFCPNDTATSLCKDTLFYDLPIATDNCGILQIVLDSGIQQGQAFPQGITTQYFTAFDLSGNTASCSFNVRIDSLPFVALQGDTTICDHDEILLSAGIPLNASLDTFFTYLWSNGDTMPSTLANTFGTYWVIKTDSFGCSSIDTSIISHYTSPVHHLNDTSICIGDTITLDGSDGNYNYMWNDSSTNRFLDVWLAGTYSVIITDTNTCFEEAQMNLGINQLPSIDIGSDTIICEGEVLFITAPGQLEGIQWSTGATNTTFIGVDTAGTYSITITDNNSCQNSDTINVGLNLAPVVDLGDRDTICDGDSIVLNAGAGFTFYSWSTGSFLQEITVFNQGSYAVVVRDTAGCAGNGEFSLVVNPNPILDLGPDIRFCDTDSTIIQAQIGMANYNWSPAISTTNELTAFTAGVYSLTITDLNGCDASDSLQVIVDTLPIISLPADTTVCINNSIQLSGPPGMNSYTWNNGALTQQINALTPRNYQLTVIDSNGCSNTSIVFNLSNYPASNINLGNNQSICAGDTFRLSVPNTFATYSWNIGGTANSIFIDSITSSSISADSTFIIELAATDTNGCAVSDSMSLTIRTLPNPNLGPDRAFCANLNFSTTVTPGVGFTGYLWSTGSTSNSVVVTQTAALPLLLIVTVTDNRGCSNSDSITISQNFLPPVSINTTQTLRYCSGENYINVASATSGYSAYSWSDGSNGNIILIDTAGVFSVTVTDNNGCQNSAQITVIEFQTPEVNLGPDRRFCITEIEDISVLLTASPVPGFTYNWNTNENTRQITATSAGTYAVSVTSTNNCTGFDEMEVIVEDLPAINFIGDTLLCVPSANTPIDTQYVFLDASTPGYNYVWQDSSLAPVFRVDTPGFYSVFMFNGICEYSQSVTIKQEIIPLIDLGQDQVRCQGDVLVLDATFIPSKVQYLWNTGSRDSIISADRDGIYSVEVFNNCGTFIDDIEVRYEDCYNIWVPNSFTPNNDGDNDYFQAVSGQLFTKFNLKIYNRFGEEIFHSSDIERSWDGTHNGVACPIGSYNYVIDYISAFDPNGAEFRKSGVVSILR